MGVFDFGPPGNVVRVAVAACLWPTTFKNPDAFQDFDRGVVMVSLDLGWGLNRF